MLIGVIADTHDRLTLVDRALELFEDRGVEAMIHAGDLIAPFAAKRLLRLPVPLHVVYGNNDGERDGLAGVLPQIQDGPLGVDLAGKKILVHHYIGWCDAQDVERADVVISGHSHEASAEQRDGTLLLNPGECGGWLHGKCTVALLETETMKVEFVELVPARKDP